LYLQLTAGVGFPHIAFTVDDPTHSNDYSDSRKGPSIGGSLLLGAPLRPGIVLGAGGIVALSALGRSHPTSNNGEHLFLVDVKESPVQTMSIVGPFVDVYPSPALGWHVQALVGYALLSRQNFYSEGGPSGIAIVAGVGHDWWLSKRWSAGLLARLTYANAHLAEDYAPRASISERDTLISPSLEASFTFH